MKNRREAGSALEILIVGIVLVGAFALIAWRYIETDKAQNDADRTLASQSISSPPNSQLSLSALGVKIRVTSLMTQTYGTLTATKVDGGYEIRSKKIAKAEWKCDGENTGLIGKISAAPNGPIKVGEASYLFSVANSRDCFVISDTANLIDQFRDTLPSVTQPLN